MFKKRLDTVTADHAETEDRKVGGLEEKTHRCIDAKMHSPNNVNSLPSYLPTLQPSKKAAFTLAEETCPPLEGGPKSLISRRGKSLCRSALRKRDEAFGNEDKKIGRLEDRLVTFKPVNSLPSYPPTLQPSKKAAFTLAEVLITLAIIGVVAAMTIPTLWAKIGSKVSENQQKVFQAKLIKGLNLAKTAGDIHDKYSSTEDFLRNGLSKHLKMSAICGADNLRDCIPYDEIKVTNNGEDVAVSVSSLKTAASINLSAPFEDTAAFIMADGTPVLISYDKTCVVDTEKLDREINSCVAGLYDLTGARRPNKLSNDILAFNGTSIVVNNKPACLVENDDICIISVYKNPEYLDKTACEAYLGAGKCPYNQDYWAWSKQKCEQDGGHLPDRQEMAKLISSMYTSDIGYVDMDLEKLYTCYAAEDPCGDGCEVVSGLRFDPTSPTAKATTYDASSNSFWLWTSELYEDGTDYAYYGYFNSDNAYVDLYERGNGVNGAVCLGD